MDRNSIIGILIIFALLMTWSYLNQPTEEELAAEQARRDSLAQVQEQPLVNPETAIINTQNDSSDQKSTESAQQVTANDSVVNLQLQQQYGPFAASAQGEDKNFTLENDFLQLEFSAKGGRIAKATLKQYDKILLDENKEETKIPVEMLEDEKNKFEYLLPVAGVPGGLLSTEDLYFTPQQEGNTLILRAQAGAGQYIEHRYTLQEDYKLDYDLRLVGLDGILDRNAESITLNWVNYMNKLEINTSYERMYSTVYFKAAENGVDYCSCRSDDEEELNKPVKWVSHAHQFFNSSLIADESFASAELEVKMMEEESEDLKKTVSRIKIPIARLADEKIGMHMYIGPNEFKRLASYDLDLEDVIPFGWSIFGTINRWIIRPIFGFLSSFIGSAGIVILVLTFIVKAALYPLTYKMLYSQSKMGALKPEISKVRDRFKDDQQKQQMETMKLYREFGANPLGGCFPIALQMPIWFALYRFFPASIEFRQASFLWATDLSSYDVFMWLPYEIPFYGSHISLFTLLWAGTTVIYTYYNSRHMDMSMNPTMKYMQYFMPIMFLFFFNNFAAGLTCYLLFSNILNITQTLVTKNLIIDQDKIKREMEAYRKKPKKKKGFQQRLEQALKEQQRIAEEKQKKNKKK
jgi:YidC/Oxa1 family membrane protein insertase